MLEAGDVVTVQFVGANGTKRRPAVVVSSALYHAQRPDVILGVVTSNIGAATATTDHVLSDWSAAGLRLPSAFRAYFGMALPSAVTTVGRLSARDWRAVQTCVRHALA